MGRFFLGFGVYIIYRARDLPIPPLYRDGRPRDLGEFRAVVGGGVCV